MGTVVQGLDTIAPYVPPGALSPANFAAPTAQPDGTGAAGTSGNIVRADHVHPFSAFIPADHGMLGWSADPGVFGASTPTTVVAGTLQVIKLWVPVAGTIANLYLQVQTAGVTLTANQCLASWYDSTKTLVATSADQSGTWNSGGLKTMPVTANPVTPGFIYFAWFYNGTTPPRFLANTSGTSAVNVGLAAAASRYATADTGRTTTMPGTLGAFTANGQAVWCAVGP